MSDPVSNAEIEDVLSSIRRLVSVEKRGQPHGTDPARAPSDQSPPAPTADAEAPALETQDAGEARLVLTPSFRVTPDDEDTADAPDEETEHLTLGQWQVRPDEGDDAASADTADDDGPGPQDETEEPGTFVDDASDPAPEDADIAMAGSQDEAHEDDDAHLKDWLTAEDRPDDIPDDWRDEELHAEGEDAASDVDHEVAAFADDNDVAFEYSGPDAPEEGETETPDGRPVTSELEARIAEVEAAVAARDDQWDPDGASEDAYAGGKTEPLRWEDHVDLATPVFVSHSAQDEAAAAPDTEIEDEAPRPDISATGAFTSRRDADEAARDRQPDRTADAPGAEGSWYREDTDAVLDEDALRDLVSEIVRQELQGTLGERITRNVRKLVRREIHRAMMGRDLD
jgi:hypothetical protein